ncbi:hypothetical protein PIB30_052301 [Stylosanthes scabra]|uniref:Uncharacterized protein n=1 Tax=Stylosanthes scabra TaxID=79078 RepID=A0ABU6SJ11_9FABA|nr:hypothetical protein [Stylosanthes scabra]
MEELTIYGCEKLACSFPRAPKLHQLYVIGDSCPDKEEGNIVILETQLANSALECLTHIQAPQPLQHKSLTELKVFCCDSLTLFPLGALPNLKTLKITYCPEMDSFGEDCLPPSLTTLEISGCEKLERLITSKGLQAQGLSLTHLILQHGNEVKKSFPREGFLPASLQSLKLVGFRNLETLDCDGLHHLTSLKQLSIEFGLKLEEMNDPRVDQFKI